jgi:hypothetical protein
MRSRQFALNLVELRSTFRLTLGIVLTESSLI